MTSPEISIVTAMSRWRGLGENGDGRGMWYMPDDLLRFRETTNGHAVIIAAKTFEAIWHHIGGPLPERTNIVVGDFHEPIEDCITTNTFREGLDIARRIDPDEVFVMGDQVFYTEALPSVTKLYVTVVKGHYPTTEQFPAFRQDFRHVSSEAGSSGGYDYDYEIYERTIKE